MNARPRWLPWIAAGLAIALFSGLGVWQLQRAAEKRAVIASLADNRQPVLERLPGTSATLREAARREVRIQGRYEGERQFLLDNRILEGRPGFDVLTPLVLDDGRRVLVDRGWVAAGAGREPVESVRLAFEERVTVEGRLWLPESGIALGAAVTPGDDWPRLVTRVDFPALEEALGRELVPAVIRATGDAPWLFRPRDLQPRFGPMRHYGYAFQWFALALTVLAVACILEWRRRRMDKR
ncbi:MAG: SURF1 family protein [Halofilum sp. (in: g-proteobacteria)]|nr:SURF1 family protein [Halofilum sp. (in: g-proteobacteria)]